MSKPARKAHVSYYGSNRKSPRTGHLLSGAVAFTVVEEYELLGRHTSESKRIETFDSLEAAANFALDLHLRIQTEGAGGTDPDTGIMYYKTVTLYCHTKGKVAYSPGHYKRLNWIDFDHREARREANIAAFWQKLSASNPKVLVPQPVTA